MKKVIKKIARNVLPHGYMRSRRKMQRIQILGEQSEPRIYNEYGERKRVFYIEDSVFSHTPYTMVLGQEPRFILWDRYNAGLPVQFYSCEYVTGKINKNAKKRMALFNESETIVEQAYQNIIKNKEIAKEYDKIFTFSEVLLNDFDNALFMPASGLWYGTKENGGFFDPERYMKKTNMLSVVCSGKAVSEYHRIRQRLSKKIVEAGIADGYGKYFENYIESKSQALDNYRYSLVVENDIKPYYFSEKILDCFAAMTIPVYVGADRIGDFFNSDGIIQVKKGDYDRIEEICRRCDRDEYEGRIEAVIDNYERVKKYRCIEDYIYRSYEAEFDI